MLKFLRPGGDPPPPTPQPAAITQAALADPGAALSLRALNALHEHIKQRVYRVLVPSRLLARFDIDPITWEGPDKQTYVHLTAKEGTGRVQLNAFSPFDPTDPFLEITLEDNTFGSVDLAMLVLSDPEAPRFNTDYDEAGRPTHFGTAGRNLPAEQRAMQAGLAPGQTRDGLRGSAEVLNQIETLLIALGQHSLALEPITYAAAWVFEKRGFAYVRGHKKMDGIHREFQPGGRLHAALDGSTPFRQPEQWNTVRGRAWAIHDGILEAADTSWDKVKMIKPVGRHARVSTFPDGLY